MCSVNNKTRSVRPQAINLIQNIPQTIDTNGEYINFQIFNKNKYVRLLPDSFSIKIRKTGSYLLNVSGSIKWTALQDVNLSFALLKNNIPINNTINNVTIPSGTLIYNESISKIFTFNRGDILKFEAESSVSSTTVVPLIVSNGNTFYGNGLTLQIQPLDLERLSATNFSTTYPVGASYYNNKPNGIYVGRTFFNIDNVDVVVSKLESNLGDTVAYSYIGQDIGGKVYVIYIFIRQISDNSESYLTCITPYTLLQTFVEQN